MIKTYISIGWSIFPCNGKIPSTPNGFKDSVKNEEDFNLLVAKYPGTNVGVATGSRSGVLVLDVDVKNCAGGYESLQELIKKHGPLPKTVEAMTWSGGRHYFFKYVDGVRNRTGFMKGLDIRSEGGYVIAAPSSIEGKPYKWLVPPGSAEIAPPPEWLLKILGDKPQHSPLPQGDGLIATGNRNQELTRRAGKMRNAGMDSIDIYAALCKINATRCSPPLTDREVRTISESIGNYQAGGQNAAFTDLWNAERFTAKYGKNIRWCDRLGGWFMWDGVAWRPCDQNYLMRWAKEFVRGIGVEAEAAGDKKMKAHAARSESAGKLTAILELAKSEPSVAAGHEDFDRNNHLLNCSNGTLNLDTGEIREARREDYLTKSISVAYDPAAKCPTWLKFLEEVFQGDLDLIEYVRRAVGYCLSGHTTEQKFFMCVGNGRNGKSTFLKHLMNMMAPHYASGTPAATMLETDGNVMNAIAALKGMRLVVLNEFDEGKTMSAAQVKNLTGGEPVVARYLYHEQFVYTPTYKFWLTTNFKPRIKDTSLGIWRRLVIIPFDYTVPADKIDPHLDEKLAAEYPGILAWAAIGYRQWREHGLPQLDRLAKVASVYQSDSDMIGQFIEECHDEEVTEQFAETSVVDFIAAFREWANENGIRHIPGRNAIMDYMEKKGYGRPQKNNSASMRGRLSWKKIAIRTKHWSPSAI